MLRHSLDVSQIHHHVTTAKQSLQPFIKHHYTVKYGPMLLCALLGFLVSHWVWIPSQTLPQLECKPASVNSNSRQSVMKSFTTPPPITAERDSWVEEPYKPQRKKKKVKKTRTRTNAFGVTFVEDVEEDEADKEQTASSLIEQSETAQADETDEKMEKPQNAEKQIEKVEKVVTVEKVDKLVKNEEFEKSEEFQVKDSILHLPMFRPQLQTVVRSVDELKHTLLTGLIPSGTVPDWIIGDVVYDSIMSQLRNVAEDYKLLLCPLLSQKNHLINDYQSNLADSLSWQRWITLQCATKDYSIIVAKMNWAAWNNHEYAAWRSNYTEMMSIPPLQLKKIHRKGKDFYREDIPAAELAETGYPLDPSGLVPSTSKYGKPGVLAPSDFNFKGICGKDGYYCVISFGLYGNDDRYLDGAIQNAQLLPKIFPGWDMRVYHDASVDEDVLKDLKNLGVELIQSNCTGRGKNSFSSSAVLYMFDVYDYHIFLLFVFDCSLLGWNRRNVL